MTEDEARAHAAAIAPEAMPALERYAELLIAENGRQNLIARSTESSVWQRHILDSLQLAQFARRDDRTWLDVGSGPGLPGVVIAALGRWAVTLVEPRRRRVEFLEGTVTELGLAEVTVVAADVRTVKAHHDVVSARAVASIPDLFAITRSCADRGTRFILPKGRTALADVESSRAKWHGVFHVEQSLTEPSAGIVIADGVAPR